MAIKIGLHLRNSGPDADRALLRTCARIADELGGIDDLWVFDHVAISPDQAEGSEGHYIDPLAALAFIAGVTERVSIGTRVLILPYRPALPTAKWIASLQALSDGRLRLGIGVGWMGEEFRALGVERSRRGQITDETLDLIDQCFAADEVEANGQPFLFRPRPKKPPIYVGGRAPYALTRAARYGDGWAVQRGDPESLREPAAELQRLFEEAGKPRPEIIVPIGASADEIPGLNDRIAQYEEIGATRIAINARYATVDEFRRIAEGAARLGKDIGNS